MRDDKKIAVILLTMLDALYEERAEAIFEEVMASYRRLKNPEKAMTKLCKTIRAMLDFRGELE